MSSTAVAALGASGYILLMAAGYAYNLTFVQLGLTRLGRERIGLADGDVAAAMAGLAVVTCVVALGAGFRMRGWGVRRKLSVAAAVVAVQTVLTTAAPLLGQPQAFAGWLAVAAVALGVGVPATFGLATDLVPVRWRGPAAAAVTALAYGGSLIFLAEWDVGTLARLLVPAMTVGAVGLALLAVGPGPVGRLIEGLQQQAADPSFARGRFIGPKVARRMLVAAAVLFGIFFVDSLGFVRLVDTAYIAAAWQSPDAADRTVLIAAHVGGAIAAGVLYRSFDDGFLLPWVFGIFALVALMYVADVRAGMGGPSQVLAMPILYAVGVSLYTVLTFALWPDLSTPETVTRNVAIGVALSAWSATFLSTAVALAWRTSGVDLDRHLSSVAAVALVALAAIWIHRLLRPAAEAVA